MGAERGLEVALAAQAGMGFRGVEPQEKQRGTTLRRRKERSPRHAICRSGGCAPREVRGGARLQLNLAAKCSNVVDVRVRDFLPSSFVPPIELRSAERAFFLGQICMLQLS